VHIAAASEAIAFAAKQGLDIRKVYEVITASAGNSWMFENRMPHVLDGDYSPRSAVRSSSKTSASSRTWRARRNSRCRLQRRAADVLDDGRIRHGPR
jgi:3-hydroxyisobutyrate dehydrogenase-like beta-hydroxyacid dehydrogenase